MLKNVSRRATEGVSPSEARRDCPERVPVHDPKDETGAFLTPEDLVEIDHAYLRLQTDGSGVPTNPNDNNKVAANADDEFIKKKIALALQRAIPNQPFSRVNSQTSNI